MNESKLEKAITGLENLRDSIATDYIHDTYQAIGTINDALELLKKQKPMKVIDRNVSIGYAICPSCKKIVIHQQIDFTITNYCGRCGQAVKWE